MTDDDEAELDDSEEERRAEEEKVLNQANFFTLDYFIDMMDDCISRECGPSYRQYHRHNLMDFTTFRDTLYPQLRYNQKPAKLDPLVLWTQIRTHIKGSFEAWKDTATIMTSSGPQICRGMLSLEAYMNVKVFPPSRCRLDIDQRREAYDLFTKYQASVLCIFTWSNVPYFYIDIFLCSGSYAERKYVG